jgi:hypothetical protein
MPCQNWNHRTVSSFRGDVGMEKHYDPEQRSVHCTMKPFGRR